MYIVYQNPCAVIKKCSLFHSHSIKHLILFIVRVLHFSFSDVLWLNVVHFFDYIFLHSEIHSLGTLLNCRLRVLLFDDNEQLSEWGDNFEFKGLFYLDLKGFFLDNEFCVLTKPVCQTGVGCMCFCHAISYCVILN